MACVADLVDAALRCTKVDPRFAYVAPFYVQAKDVAWGYLKRFTAPIDGVKFNEAELRVDLPNGARIRLYGADNYDRMRGVYLDGVVLDEYADMPPGAWSEVIRPALSDREGWAIFIGTPKGRNEFWRVWENAQGDPAWFTMMLKASDSGIVATAELADAAKDMTPEQYAQEFECSFDAAIIGAYYAADIVRSESEGRIGVFPADPSLPVHTAWDLGIGDSTAIWLWQAAPDGLRVIDHIEDHGKPLAHYVAELSARGHRYGFDFVPHDAKARELGTGRTRVETLDALGRHPRLAPMHTVDDGINATRVMFERMRFDAEHCAAGIEALRQYRTDYDEKTKAFRDRPRHDWTSHTADAARYMALAYRDLVKPAEKPKIIHPPGTVFLPGAPKPPSGVRIRI